jgi:hypothetical protein
VAVPDTAVAHPLALPHATAIPEPLATGTPTVGSAIGVLLDELRRAGAGPFLDLPLPQLPPPSELPPQPPRPEAIGPDLSQVLAPPGPAAIASTGRLATGPTAIGQGHLPALPPNPVDALLHGGALPGMPGVDQIMSPLLGLLNSFGSGEFGALNPTTILHEGALVMDEAMQVGTQALGTLAQNWRGGAATAAQATGRQAADRGQDVSFQGKTIAEVTNRAADEVNRGYQQLLGVVRDFAAMAVPLAASGAILTPPGQGVLMSVATTAFSRATAVVGMTRATLGTLTAEVNAAGGLVRILANSGVDLPTLADQAVQVAQPLVAQATDSLTSALTPHEGSTDGAGFEGAPPADFAERTTAASFDGGTIGDLAGMGGFAGGAGGFGADAGGLAGGPVAGPRTGGGPLAEPTLGGAPGGLGLGSPGDSMVASVGAAAAGPQQGGGAAPVGGMAPAAGAGRGQTPHHRSVQPYHPSAHRVNPGMEPVAPAVLGADDPELDARYEHEYGYYTGPGDGSASPDL